MPREKFNIGDKVKDLTFEPYLIGAVTGLHDKPDTYIVRLEDGLDGSDAIIHARNLARA